MGTQDPPERSLSFQPGQSFGKFYLVQTLGEGGTSRIFKALQQPISRVVALKIPTFLRDGQILTPEEFLSEATLMARLDHGNIVRIHDFGVEDGRAFICMEHVEGWNLLELVERRHPLSAAAVLSIGLQTLEALLHAHSRDVLHQDLSPANVLVSRTGCVKLIDFGMAGKRPLSKGGNIIGTPAFLSPEHVAGEPPSARSDLFCFGSLLYFAATGLPLFDPGEGHARIREAFLEIEKARWQPPLEKLRSLPSSLSRMVRAALEGGDPGSMLRDLQDLWVQAEGQARPEDALRRELIEAAEADAGSDPVSEKELRERYLRLRSEGRHREAVALLERALRRQPDNPLLRDLLSLPPARAKSAPVTMEVAAPPGNARRRPAWALALALVAGTLAALVLTTASFTAFTRRGGDAAVRQDAEAAVPFGPGSAAPAEPASPANRPGAAPAAPDLPGLSRVSATMASSAPPAASAAVPARRKARPAQAAPISPRPPALSLFGPRGTRVLVNDSLEFTSPAPREGWILPKGLVNLLVTRPDRAQPLTSSLFVAADTLYVLHLEEGGGFSVSRRRR